MHLNDIKAKQTAELLEMAESFKIADAAEMRRQEVSTINRNLKKTKMLILQLKVKKSQLKKAEEAKNLMILKSLKVKKFLRMVC